MHPVSAAIRPVRPLIAENGITCEELDLDSQRADAPAGAASLRPTKSNDDVAAQSPELIITAGCENSRPITVRA
jgi:hypothetical protein